MEKEDHEEKSRVESEASTYDKTQQMDIYERYSGDLKKKVNKTEGN